MEKLQAVFNRIGARKRLLILDACHSGNAAAIQMHPKGSPGTDTLKLAKRGLNAIRNRASNVVSERNYAEIVKQQLTDVNDETGVIVFSATSGGGAAFESDRWGNGIFTSMLIRALSSDVADENNDKKLQVQELIEYVIRAVNEATNGQQLPESSIITWDRNWILKERY